MAWTVLNLFNFLARLEGGGGGWGEKAPTGLHRINAIFIYGNQFAVNGVGN